MGNRKEQMAELIELLEKNTPKEGICETNIDSLITFRGSEPHHRVPQVFDPGIIFAIQGKKNIYLEGKRYSYNSGNFLTLFAPLPVECEALEATPEKPILGAGIYFNQNRLANLMLKIDAIEQPKIKTNKINPSALFIAPLDENMLDALERLLRTLNSPTEASILGETIIDEIYFRVLINEQRSGLIYLLQQRGQIKQISKAVEYVHQNLDKILSVEDLASIVNMSASGFSKKFKEVMHLSPLQYAKSIKLSKAKNYIMEGKSVSEASFMVGYNSPAQFSREYKRYFGVVPSAT